MGNPKSYFSTVLFIHNSDNLRYLRIEQTVTLLSTTSEKCYHTSLQNAKLFHLTKGNVAFLKALVALERAGRGLALMALKRSGCGVWQLECQAGNVTAIVTRAHQEMR